MSKRPWKKGKVVLRILGQTDYSPVKRGVWSLPTLRVCDSKTTGILRPNSGRRQAEMLCAAPSDKRVIHDLPFSILCS